MKSPKDMVNLQIDITNACIHQCSNCTRFCGHHKKPYFMNFETFKRAVDSFDGWNGCVGIIGGEPTLHPEFEKFVEYLRNKRIGKQLNLSREPICNMQEHIYENLLVNPNYQMGLWSSLNLGYYKYFEVINDSFDMQFLNDHDNKCMHQAILISRKELGITDETFIKRRDNCFAQNNWSATITPKGAFFCEVAAHLDMLFNGPGGWPIEKGWYNRQPNEFGEQLQWCEFCGLCLDVPKRISCDERDDISPKLLKRLQEIGSPKIKKDKYVIFDPQNYDEANYKSFKNANDYMDAGGNQRASINNRMYYPKEFIIYNKQGLKSLIEEEKPKDWIIVSDNKANAIDAKNYFKDLVINPGCIYKFKNCTIFNVIAKSIRNRIFDIDKFDYYNIEKYYPKDKIIYVSKHYKLKYSIKRIKKILKKQVKNLLNIQKNIFSIHNKKIDNLNYKVLTIFSKTFKLFPIEEYYIIKLQGGFGNQMFQYAFGKSLEKNTNKKVYYDYSWFKNKKTGKEKTANGINYRNFELKIFNIKLPSYETKKFNIITVKKKIKSIYTECIPNKFDETIYTMPSGTYFDGYFQNEKYLESIKEELKKDFVLPTIDTNDKYNQNLLNKITSCENPVFIHVRRDDYLSFNAELNIEFYKKSAQYIAEKIEKPTFFVFCAEDPNYIKENFDIGYEYELIGENNKTEKNYYENLRLMMACRFGILANSSYSWWATYLSNENKEIIIAPFPWMNGVSDEIICDNWIKIER